MKHNFKKQRYFCSYCEKFRMKHLFYFKNIFLQDKNNKVICIYCWKLQLHLKIFDMKKKKGSINEFLNNYNNSTLW